MVQLIHCADLHLSQSERDYSLAVLSEIITVVEEYKAPYLILAGDIFDSFESAEALKSEFRKRIYSLKNLCEILFLPGNHEELQGKNRSLSSLDLGPVTLLERKPFQMALRESVEFLAIPHQENYSDYRDWAIPEKKMSTRIAIAHGVVAGLSYTGTEEESGGSALDPDIFLRFQVDYAALGHIHNRKNEAIDGITLSYPGSARVWRRKEFGERGVNLVSLDKNIEVLFLPLSSAGQYREYNLPLNLMGEAEGLESIGNEWKEPDWIQLIFSGIVENENDAAAMEEELLRKHRKIRKIEVDREKVSAFPGIASHPLAKEFLRIWKQMEPDEDRLYEKAAWLRAREMALGEIKNHLEVRE